MSKEEEHLKCVQKLLGIKHQNSRKHFDNINAVPERSNAPNERLSNTQ